MASTNSLYQAVERLHNPKPGGAIEAARRFGIDLTLLIERLQLGPEERLRQLQISMENIAQIKGTAINARIQTNK